MKSHVNVSMVQFSPRWLDSRLNAESMATLVDDESTEHDADLVVFPELATTGYVRPHTEVEFAQRLYRESETIPGPTTEALGEVALRNSTHVIVGISQRDRNVPELLYNSAALIGPTGDVLGVHKKVHPCLDEKNYYAPGSEISVFPTEIGRLAINICYDVRFPEVARVQALQGAEMIVSLWASFVQPGKVPEDSIVQRCATRAMENAVYFLGCNRSGEEKDRHFYGRSAIADPSGEIVASSDSDKEEVVRAILHSQTLSEQRAYLTIFRDRRPELYGSISAPL